MSVTVSKAEQIYVDLPSGNKWTMACIFLQFRTLMDMALMPFHLNGCGQVDREAQHCTFVEMS